MDEFLFFWHKESHELVIPRGFAWKLRQILRRKRVDLEWEDNRISYYIEDGFNPIPIDLRDYQERPCQRILEVEQGIYQGPTGSGKTITVLEAIRRTGQRALIIVNSKHIAFQWQERISEFLDYESGFIGDNEFSTKSITVAMQQTLWSRRRDLSKQNFWSNFGFICLDECHHASAETFKYIVEKFPAKYRIGVSATPNKGQANPIAQVVLGDIFYATSEQEVKKVIIKPQIERIKTDFRFTYQPTFRVSYRDICVVPGCRRKGGHVHRNNYQDLLKNLAIDSDRNNLIVSVLSKNIDHGNLIISRSLKQLETLYELTLNTDWYENNAFLFTGKQTLSERKKIMARATKGNVILFSTIADEALDIPRLDRLYIVYPTRNPDLLVQQIGRGRRKAPGKKDLIVYDFIDQYVGVLRNQAKEREEQVYKRAA